MTYAEYIDYFDTAARNNKKLLHESISNPKRKAFYQIDIIDIANGAKFDMVDMCLMLECPEIRLVDQKSDNLRQYINGAFLVIQEVKKGDIVDKKTVLNNTLIVSEQIVAKMINDNKKSLQNKNYTPVMRGLDTSSFHWQKVGPELSNHFGWRCEFILNQSFTNNLQLNEADWNHETKFSII
jgi:archaellin